MTELAADGLFHPTAHLENPEVVFYAPTQVVIPHYLLSSSSVVTGFVVSRYLSIGVVPSGGLISRRWIPQTGMGSCLRSCVGRSITFRKRFYSGIPSSTTFVGDPSRLHPTTQMLYLQFLHARRHALRIALNNRPSSTLNFRSYRARTFRWYG